MIEIQLLRFEVGGVVVCAAETLHCNFSLHSQNFDGEFWKRRLCTRCAHTSASTCTACVCLPVQLVLMCFVLAVSCMRIHTACTIQCPLGLLMWMRSLVSWRKTLFYVLCTTHAVSVFMASVTVSTLTAMKRHIECLHKILIRSEKRNSRVLNYVWDRPNEYNAYLLH